MTSRATERRQLQDGLIGGARIGGGRYILQRKIGHGESGEVWLARDVKMEENRALKFLPTNLSRDVHLLQVLSTEVRRSALLAHAHIARIYELVSDYQFAAVASEYVEGWTVAAMSIDRPGRRYSIEEITPWIFQIGSALEYAHDSFCLVHRALKPSNLLLDGRGRLKLTDFGIAHLLHTPEGGSFGSESVVYLSPQQLDGAEPSVLDDIYSLGATIFELLTGTPPFDRGDIAGQIRTSEVPRMNQRLGDLRMMDSIPGAWEELVAGCLAKDPGKRPQSATEIMRTLIAMPKPEGTSASRPLNLSSNSLAGRAGEVPAGSGEIFRRNLERWKAFLQRHVWEVMGIWLQCQRERLKGVGRRYRALLFGGGKEE